MQGGALSGTCPQTCAKVEEFMATLDKPKAHWDVFHMIVAQQALRRPIHFA